jgi:hypothetical protein
VQLNYLRTKIQIENCVKFNCTIVFFVPEAGGMYILDVVPIYTYTHPLTQLQTYKNCLVYTYLECKISIVNEQITIYKCRSCIAVGKKCGNLVTNALKDATTNRPTYGDQAKHKLDAHAPNNWSPSNLRHSKASFSSYLIIPYLLQDCIFKTQ